MTATPITDNARKAAVVDAMTSALSANKVLSAPEELGVYAETLTAPADSTRLPALAVLPESTDDVQTVLAVARANNAIIWHFCNGMDIGEGAPQVAGAIALDLRNMNKIVEINERLAYCVVEPGVTYRALHEALEARGVALTVDSGDNPEESVIAGFLDRKAGYTGYADHFLMQCGMEAILPDGELVRTGMGAMPNSDCWQLFKFGYGPWVDGAFTQSNYGVVTKLGMWLMPKPPAAKPFMVSVDNFDSLAPLVDALQPLKINMVVTNGVAITNGLYEAALHGSRPNSDGPVSDAEAKTLAEFVGVGEWNLFGCLYGVPKNVEFAWNIVKQTFEAVPGATVHDADSLGADDRVWKMRSTAVIGGAPQDFLSPLAKWNGGGIMRVSPVSSITGADVLWLAKMQREVCARHSQDFLASFDAVWRNVNHTATLTFDRNDPDARASAQACAEEIVSTAAANGFGQSHSAPELEHLSAGIYDWNNGAQQQLAMIVKDALDPEHILSPGKAAIGG